MSEAELHLLKQRMYQGILQKARRGALSFALPIGSVHNASGEVVYDPDEQVQHVVRLIFRKWLLLDSRGVDVPMAYNPTFVMLSSLKPLFFNSLKNELPFLDNAGA